PRGDTDDEYTRAYGTTHDSAKVVVAKPAWGTSSQHRYAESGPHQERGDGARAPHDPRQHIPEASPAHGAQRYESSAAAGPSMRVRGAPQILAEWVLHVGRIADYKGKFTHPTDHHGRENNQKDAGQKARSVSHDCLHSVREPASELPSHCCGRLP